MKKPLILVVEDNAVLQRVIDLLARRHNVDAEIVSNGKEALSAIATGKEYALCLMDWRMPDMDGLECTAHIRRAESPNGRRLPIIAMTANVGDEHKETCMHVGMDDYMSKPFSGADFNALLDRWLNHPESRQAV